MFSSNTINLKVTMCRCNATSHKISNLKEKNGQVFTSIYKIHVKLVHTTQHISINGWHVWWSKVNTNNMNLAKKRKRFLSEGFRSLGLNLRCQCGGFAISLTESRYLMNLWKRFLRGRLSRRVISSKSEWRSFDFPEHSTSSSMIWSPKHSTSCVWSSAERWTITSTWNLWPALGSLTTKKPVPKYQFY